MNQSVVRRLGRNRTNVSAVRRPLDIIWAKLSRDVEFVDEIETFQGRDDSNLCND